MSKPNPIPGSKPFKKGQSGNPSGRPKGLLNSKTIIRKWMELEEKIKNPVSGEFETLSQYDVIALAQIAKARKGDTSAFNALLDRLDGKPKQEVETTVQATTYNVEVTKKEMLEINKALENDY